jgi:asparagine synthase (glutamine-hydrolysing)
MADLLPADVLWRRTKMGFPFPYERFFATYRPIVDAILDTARNPFIDCSKRERLRADWRALSFILWYEMYINDNRALFRRIEGMAERRPMEAAPRYVPAFLEVGAT